MSGKNKPIGVFDSGLGGLSVVKELRKQMPSEDIIYFGDTARVPYGTKSKESIIRFSCENAEMLLSKNVKMIVVACNSSTSYALGVLRKKYDIPIMGVIEPGAKKAVAETNKKRVGIIATSATINSSRYQDIIKRLNSSIKVFAQSCPLFVPIVEEGWLKGEVTISVVNEYLSGLKNKKIDTLVLGCTHYPLLKPAIKKVMGKEVYLVDSAKETASEVKRFLGSRGMSKISAIKGKSKYFISDRPQEFERIAKKFLGHEIKVTVRSSHV